MGVSMQSGGGSKDVWVLGEDRRHLSRSCGPRRTRWKSAAQPRLPSRVADNLFWLGRYAERVEAGVRVARTILPRFFQEGDSSRAAGLKAGLDILAGARLLRRRYARGSPAERDVLAMIYDPDAPNGFVANIHQVRRVAWLLRDRISLDAWLILNQLDQQFSSRPPAEAMQVGAAQDLLNHAVITLSAFGGLVMESMTRGDGWRFLDIGRRLERALQMTELLRKSLGPTPGRTSESSRPFSKWRTAPSPTGRAI